MKEDTTNTEIVSHIYIALSVVASMMDKISIAVFSLFIAMYFTYKMWKEEQAK